MNHQLKRLTAVHSLPFFTPSGRMVSKPGHDAETGIWLHLPFDYCPAVPMRPSKDQVQSALIQLMKPFRGYRWAGADDAAAAVCAVLTAVARPTLELCPAILTEASTQASGKTKAASALGSLLTGRLEGVTRPSLASMTKSFGSGSCRV
ncbi:MAG: hypothetical protein AB3X44_20495 [Leptothrix sp. (in: b-proteobacteria)]